MLRDVSSDLIPFLLLFFVMVILSGQTFAVLGLGASSARRKKGGSVQVDQSSEEGLSVDERIGGRFLFYIFNSLRYSLNNYTIDDSKELPFRENIIYWVLW